MAKRLDLTGWTFERLGITGQAENNQCGKTQWHYVCICGKEGIVSTNNLTSGNTKSCGCLNKELSAERGRMNKIDLTGKTIGMLEIIRDIGRTKHGNVIFICRCINPDPSGTDGICGTIQSVASGYLLSGKIYQCSRCSRRQSSNTQSRGYGLTRQLRQQSKYPYGLTVKEFSERRFCSPKTIRNYEKKGKSLPEGRFMPPPEPPTPSPFDIPDSLQAGSTALAPTRDYEPRRNRPKQTRKTDAGIARDLLKSLQK